MDTYRSSTITIELDKLKKTALVTFQDKTQKLYNLSEAADITSPEFTKV